MTSLSQMPAAPAFAGLIVGLAAGAWHFASLRWNGRLLASGRAVAACVLQLARFALTTALAACARACRGTRAARGPGGAADRAA